MVGSDLAEWADRWVTDEGFAAYVDTVVRDREEDAPRRPTWVPCTTLWWVDGSTYLGRIAIRHRLTPSLREVGGHIGYDVRRSARRQGHATAMLAAALPVAAALGIDPALVTCDDTNVASRKVIEHNGGAARGPAWGEAALLGADLALTGRWSRSRTRRRRLAEEPDGSMGGSHMARILITGVRGKTGAPLAELLAARPDVEVLGGSSDPSTVTTDGVRPVAFSWDEPAGWPAATDGIDAVYVVRPDRRDAPERSPSLVAGTPAAAHVVLLSEQAAESFAPDGWAVRAERAVRESGRSWTRGAPELVHAGLHRPALLPRPDPGRRVSRSPAAAPTVAWIDARDIAAVVARTLLEPGHTGQTYELSGPEALTLAQTVRLLSTALGRPVAHVEQTIEESVAGLEGFERQLEVTTMERIHAGVFATVTDTVERVTGRPARTLEAFLADW